MTATVLALSPTTRLVIAAIVVAAAVAFAGARRFAFALLVVLLVAIAAGARVDPIETTHERQHTPRR